MTAAGLVVEIARTVTERRRELTILAALGARRGRLVGMVVGEGLRPVAAGAVVGVVLTGGVKRGAEGRWRALQWVTGALEAWAAGTDNDLAGGTGCAIGMFWREGISRLSRLCREPRDATGTFSTGTTSTSADFARNGT
jgi:hypothetical protein